MNESFFFYLGDIIRQNRVIILILSIGSIVLLLIIALSISCYYYTYGRQVTKVSISKNPNYGLFFM